MKTNQKFETLKISDIGKVITGKTPPTKNSEYFGSEIPFLTPSDIIASKYVEKTERSLSESGMKLLSTIILPPNSISVSCIGSDMGKAVFIKRNTITNQQFNSVVPNDLVDPEFLYYFFKNKRGFLKNLSSGGTAQPIVKKSLFSEIQISLFPIQVQREIGKVFSDLDSEIENLQNQNKILEQITQVFFQSWFVNFDGVSEFEDSEFGKIPKGWEICQLGKLVNHQKGFVFKSSDYQKQGKKIIRITDLTKDSINLQNCVHIDEKKVFDHQYQSVTLNENDILITTVGSGLNHPESAVGRPIRVPTFVAGSLLNQNIVRLRSINHELQFFILNYIQHPKFKEYLTSRTQGSANQASLTLGTIFEYQIVLPIDDKFVKKFSVLSKIIYKKINKNQTNLENLTKIRDILLPKLMSGEIRV